MNREELLSWVSNNCESLALDDESDKRVLVELLLKHFDIKEKLAQPTKLKDPNKCPYCGWDKNSSICQSSHP